MLPLLPPAKFIEMFEGHAGVLKDRGAAADRCQLEDTYQPKRQHLLRGCRRRKRAPICLFVCISGCTNPVNPAADIHSVLHSGVKCRWVWMRLWVGSPLCSFFLLVRTLKWHSRTEKRFRDITHVTILEDTYILLRSLLKNQPREIKLWDNLPGIPPCIAHPTPYNGNVAGRTVGKHPCSPLPRGERGGGAQPARLAVYM